MDALQEEVVQPEDVEVPPPPKRDLIAAKAADAAATVWFLLANLVWWGVWIPTKGLHYDNSGFTIFTLLLSLEAIILTIAVLIQNRLEARARDKQAEADLKNNAIAAELAQQVAQQVARIEKILKEVK